MVDNIVDVEWEFVEKESMIKDHHIVNVIVAIIVLLYLFGNFSAKLIISFIS